MFWEEQEHKKLMNVATAMDCDDSEQPPWVPMRVG